jgi:uncharacterized protein YcbK (DUF882 family)
VHVGNARLNTRRLSARAGYSCGLALIFFLVGAKALQNAVAEGDTRTITMHHMHTGEDITITFKRDGQYDEAALQKLNWFLRDWRRSEQTQMDPHLVDLVWEVQREANTGSPIQVVCGYRSPETNAMLRHRSSGVARFSQHMLGHAMDFYIPGIPLEQLREIGLRLQRGGVGFYPESGSPFVHMDTAGIRMWPRMTHEQLARVFPDGRTVQIPTDGRPLAGYALALADIKKRGGIPSANSLDAARAAGVDVGVLVASNERPHSNPFARLLGLGSKDEDDEEEETVASAVPANAPAPIAPATASADPLAATAPLPPKRPVLAAIEHGARVAEKATVAAAVKVADAASKVKLIRTADAAPLQSPQQSPLQAPLQPSLPTQPASSNPPSANQIIAARGYWQGPADGTVVANPAAAAKLQRSAQAAGKPPSANADMTGAIGPFVNPNAAPAAPSLALAYADPSGNLTTGAPAPAPSAPMGIAALRAAAAPAQAAPVQGTSVQGTPVQLAPAQAESNGMTVAVKRSGNQAVSAIMTTSSTSVTVVKSDARFQSPWMRAIVLSPSVHQFLTTMALGAGDFRALATMMVKPSSAVLMTFAADPNPGLQHDHFTGASIVFVPTVSYPTHTASLQ